MFVAGLIFVGKTRNLHLLGYIETGSDSHFHPSLKFWGKGMSSPLGENPIRCSTRVGWLQCLVHSELFLLVS